MLTAGCGYRGGGGGGGDYDKKVLDSVLRYAALSQRVRELAGIGNKDKDKA